MRALVREQVMRWLWAVGVSALYLHSRMGGIPEVVADGKTGMLRAVGDCDGMARSAIELLSDSDRMKSMSRAARTRAIACFDGRSIVARYEGLYGSLLP